MRIHLFIVALSVACYSESATKVHNSTPEVQITSHSSSLEVHEMDVQIFTAQISDANHSNELLEVSWLVNEDIVCDWAAPAASGLSDCTIDFREGMERISVVARDPIGSSSNAEISLVVIPSTAPKRF